MGSEVDPPSGSWRRQVQRLRVMLGFEMKLKKRKKSRMRKFRGIPTAVSAAYVNFQSCQMYEDFFRFYIYDLEADSLCFLTTFSRPLPLPSPCPNGISCYSCYVADGRSESVPDSHAPTLPDNYGAARRAGGVRPTYGSANLDRGRQSA